MRNRSPNRWEPIAAPLLDSLRGSLEDSFVGPIWSWLWGSFGATLWDSLWNSIRDPLRISLWESIGGLLKETIHDE